MGIVRNFVKNFNGSLVLFVTVIYLIAYILFQLSGLFAPRPENIVRVLHHGPALAGASMLVLAGLTGLLSLYFRLDIEKPKPDAVLVYCAVLLIGSGILTSSLFRFEGRVVINEGQDIPLLTESYDKNSLYERKYAKPPTGKLLISAISPLLSSSNKPLLRHSAQVLYQKDPSAPFLRFNIGSIIPTFFKGYSYRIVDVGYSPHFFLFDGKGNSIKDLYAVMKLFPPGTEDSFRFDMIIPHTFYIKYYPDASLVADKLEQQRPVGGALFNVRISRNLDMIVANSYFAHDDVIPVDALTLSLGDVKKWVEISIVCDQGVYLILFGIVLVTFISIRKVIALRLR
jgi:hypothetical protein